LVPLVAPLAPGLISIKARLPGAAQSLSAQSH
jgi:hypothetical protein